MLISGKESWEGFLHCMRGAGGILHWAWMHFASKDLRSFEHKKG
jgi:hypothetical protein